MRERLSTGISRLFTAPRREQWLCMYSNEPCPTTNISDPGEPSPKKGSKDHEQYEQHTRSGKAAHRVFRVPQRGKIQHCERRHGAGHSACIRCCGNDYRPREQDYGASAAGSRRYNRHTGYRRRGRAGRNACCADAQGAQQDRLRGADRRHNEGT